MNCHTPLAVKDSLTASLYQSVICGDSAKALAYATALRTLKDIDEARVKKLSRDDY